MLSSSNIISPFSHITSAKFGGDWKISFTKRDFTLWDVEDPNMTAEMMTLIKPIENIDFIQEFIAYVNIFIYEDNPLAPTDRDRRLIELLASIDIGGTEKIRLDRLRFNRDSTNQLIADPTLASYDDVAKSFNFIAKHPNLTITEGVSKFWVNTDITISGVNNGTIYREYQDTASTFPGQPNLPANLVSPGTYKQIYDYLGGD